MVTLNRLRSVAPFVLVFLGYFVLSVLLTWPLTMHLGSQVYGDWCDSRGAIYWIWANTNGFLEGSVNSLLSAPFGKPTQVGFAQPVLEGALLGLASIWGEIKSYNIFVLLSFPLTAWSMYLFLKAMG